MTDFDYVNKMIVSAGYGVSSYINKNEKNILVTDDNGKLLFNFVFDKSGKFRRIG